jgi:hypothetical protein
MASCRVDREKNGTTGTLVMQFECDNVEHFGTFWTHILARIGEEVADYEGKEGVDYRLGNALYATIEDEDGDRKYGRIVSVGCA